MKKRTFLNERSLCFRKQYGWRGGLISSPTSNFSHSTTQMHKNFFFKNTEHCKQHHREHEMETDTDFFFSPQIHLLFWTCFTKDGGSTGEKKTIFRLELELLHFAAYLTVHWARHCKNYLSPFGWRSKMENSSKRKKQDWFKNEKKICFIKLLNYAHVNPESMSSLQEAEAYKHVWACAWYMIQYLNWFYRKTCEKYDI